jgi:ABC-type antimicrobial peptide transport system ATPase subunit
VSQGSIIEPLFFKICINDIAIDIQSTIKLFADDTSLFLIIDNPQTTTDILNRDLDKIHAWSTNWLVSFNPQKTETMTISRKINKPHHPDMFMNDTPIAEVPNHKHLGQNISKDGTHHTMTKLNEVLELMRSGKRFQERMEAGKK